MIAVEHTVQTMTVVWASLGVCAFGAAGRRLLDRFTYKPEHLAPTESQPHTCSRCRASGAVVREHLVTLDGQLVGLCPGCGAKQVPCSVIDRTLPYGPWVIDAHEPYVDPEWGLHEGACWAEKAHTGDYGLCTCTGVAA